SVQPNTPATACAPASPPPPPPAAPPNAPSCSRPATAACPFSAATSATARCLPTTPSAARGYSVGMPRVLGKDPRPGYAGPFPHPEKSLGSPPAHRHDQTDTSPETEATLAARGNPLRLAPFPLRTWPARVRQKELFR